MNAAQFIKARWKLLLCLAVLLALALSLGLLATSRREPFRAFVIATNEVADRRWDAATNGSFRMATNVSRWVRVVVTNDSSRAYSIMPVTQVMVGGYWNNSSTHGCELEQQ